VLQKRDYVDLTFEYLQNWFGEPYIEDCLCKFTKKFIYPEVLSVHREANRDRTLTALSGS